MLPCLNAACRTNPSPALEISNETVQWHISNLFTRLDAGTRRAVGRARLLRSLAGQ